MGGWREVRSKKSDCRSSLTDEFALYLGKMLLPQRAQRGTEDIGWASRSIRLRTDDTFRAIRFVAGIGDVIALTVERDDEHGASVAAAVGLVGSEDGSGSALRSDIASALAETTMAKFVSAAEKFNEVIGAVGSENQLHGAVMFVAKR